MEKVKIISMETIKPSSPTPSNLSTFKLSLLDLFASQKYTPVIIFFDSRSIHTSLSSESNFHHLLKKSLSDVLTHFYPLAGRIKDYNNSVDCNDLGVDYFEAKVNGTIFEFKSPEALHQLLPHADIISSKMAKEVPLVVQVNMFDCGGIAISVCMSHKISDASSIATFIKGWAATARGTGVILAPNFNTQLLFPLRPSSSLVSDTTAENVGDTTTYKLVIKRLVFQASKISALRARIADSLTRDDLKRLTRVEAVSALMWNSLMKSTNSGKPLSILNQPVDLRRRMDPPLPEESFGNIFWMATAVLPTTPESNNSYSLDELLGYIRVAIRKIDDNCIKKLQGDDDEVIKSMVDETCLKEHSGQKKANVYLMSSWCKFPLYESDFGWGKPIWVTSSPIEALEKNGIILMDTKDGEGIEAWIKLEQHDMDIFERNKDLLEFVSTIH